MAQETIDHHNICMICYHGRQELRLLLSIRELSQHIFVAKLRHPMNHS